MKKRNPIVAAMIDKSRIMSKRGMSGHKIKRAREEANIEVTWKAYTIDDDFDHLSDFPTAECLPIKPRRGEE